jgi:4-carboxymuconolactone decarboxylase
MLPVPKPRIPLPGPADFTPAQRKIHDDVVKGPRGVLRGPLRAVIHRPDLADRWSQLGEMLRYGTSLSPRLSELAILVTARGCDAPFEWYAHEPPARAAGVSEATIDAIRNGNRPASLAADEVAVYEYALELNRKHNVSDTTHKNALDQLGVVGVVELTALVGYYNMVAMMLNAQGIPMPEGTPSPLPEITR